MIAQATQVDGQNAVQILLLLGGITLVPAALFTITGFTRILIVLGFIRTGLGTPTAPPNQVLVGIALFLTIFVMMPTIKAVNHDAIQVRCGCHRHDRYQKVLLCRWHGAFRQQLC